MRYFALDGRRAPEARLEEIDLSRWARVVARAG
jgi:hypothetical protein